jgi:type IV pilus assembly protein PilC
MPYYRFRGVSPQGKTVQSEFEAPSKRAAKERVTKVAAANGITVQAIEARAVFNYKVEKDGRIVTGEQEAYTREELERALLKLGYQVKRVEKQFIDLKGSVSGEEVVTFIRLCSDLLKQKMSFDEILNLLFEDTSNKRLKDVIKTIQKDLKDGKDGMEVYGKHEKIFGKFATYMLGVASTSGNMAQVFESTAKFLERDAQFKKNLRRALLMPAISFIAIIGVLLFYIGYIFPATAELFVKLGVDLPPLTQSTMDWSYFLRDHWVAIIVATIIPIVAFITVSNTIKGKIFLDHYMTKIPVLGDILHKTSIEIFARVFNTLYSGSGQNVEVIKVAAEACRNTYMEKQIKEVAIAAMLKDGVGIIEAFEAANVFSRTAISRFRLGAESGTLRENALMLAEYYEVQTTYKMETVINMISLFISLFVMIVIVFITIVSAETAVIQPKPAFGSLLSLLNPTFHIA